MTRTWSAPASALSARALLCFFPLLGHRDLAVKQTWRALQFAVRVLHQRTAPW